MARTTIDELLAAARSRLIRLTPAQALQAMGSGAVLIDIRAESQITRDGTIAGALVIARNVLEWRLDPASPHCHPQAPQLDDHVIILCDQGYQSSLAAATLQQLGFARATDVEGGFQAWRDAALPTDQPAPSGPHTNVPCLRHGATWRHNRNRAIAGLSRLGASVRARAAVSAGTGRPAAAVGWVRAVPGVRLLPVV